MNEQPSPVVPTGILVVVDMQPKGFPLSRVALPGVKRELLSAMARGWSIFIVEFDLECAGQTDSEVLELLAGYANWRIVKKAKEDGAKEVIDACGAQGLVSELFRLVGVMTDVCVAQTASGLVRLLPDCTVEVVTTACTTWNSRYDWNTFPTSARIKLIAA